MIYIYNISGTLETQNEDETIDIVQLILEDIVKTCKIELSNNKQVVVTNK